MKEENKELQPGVASTSPEGEPFILDDERIDEPWNKAEENLITAWRNDCENRATLHDRSAKRNAFFFQLFSMPSVAIPLITSGVVSMIEHEDTVRYLSAVGLMLSTVVNAILTTMKFGQAENLHASVSGKYSSLLLEIDAEFAKPVRFREPVDQFALRVRLLKERLDQGAPPVY